jgi:aspartyl protease
MKGRTLRRFTMLFLLSFPASGAASSEDLPLELHNGHAYVDVRLNDAAAVPFLLDTGAGVRAPIVDESRARALHLSRAGNTTAGAIGGRVPVTFFNGARLSLGGRTIWRGRVAGLALRAQESAEGHAVGGILGYSFFSDRFVELDYPQRRLRLGQQRIGSNSLRVDLLGKVPAIEGFVTKGSYRYRVRLRVDTGEDRALVLNGRFLRRHPSIVPAGAAIAGNALGGVTRTIEGTVDVLRFGSAEQRNVRTAFNIDRAGAIASTDDDGIVGGSFLQHYRVQFDYPHRRMSLSLPGR